MFTGQDYQGEKDLSTDSRGSINIQELVEKTGRRGTIDIKIRLEQPNLKIEGESKRTRQNKETC